MPQKWDLETDVLVVGYGLAGAVAAITAHDAGARVAICEKGEYPGGQSILAGGGVKCVNNVDAATTYLTRTQAERIDSSLIRPFAEGLAENEAYLTELATINRARIKVMSSAQGLFEGVYPFPGQDAFYNVRVAEIPGFKGYPWVQTQAAGVNLMKLVFDHVEKRSIPKHLATPVLRLITDADGVVAGALVEKLGQSFTVGARKAVILACGGFEQSTWLQKQYLQGLPFYSMAPLTHTGDGILMAQKVGAALWHMWHVHGSYGFKLPEFPIAFRHPFGGSRNPKRIMPWIVVDKFGYRYMDEYHPAAQDTNHRPMELLDPNIPGYPRIPSFLIFDEAGRKRGPIAHPLAIGGHVYDWSKDNSREIKKGWILQATTIKKLAQKIKDLPDSAGLMDYEVLEATVAGWNEIVRTGKDLFHRAPGTMAPIQEPPFYAIPTWPIITNTQGGPVHNVRQQVLDPFDEPIPHLFSVGELGSFFSHLYELGGNLGECLSSGRVAGKYAAAEEPLK